jgi:hypothetical protein
VQLLADIRSVFHSIGEDKLTTDQIVRALADLEESPWKTIRKGESLDPRGLAVRLGKYGIGSKSQRDGETVFKGYSRTQFDDAWNRYLPAAPSAPDSAVTSVTTDTADTDVTDVTDKSRPEAGCLQCQITLTTPESIKAGRCAECRLDSAP